MRDRRRTSTATRGSRCSRRSASTRWRSSRGAARRRRCATGTRRRSSRSRRRPGRRRSTRPPRPPRTRGCSTASRTSTTTCARRWSTSRASGDTERRGRARVRHVAVLADARPHRRGPHPRRPRARDAAVDGRADDGAAAGPRGRRRARVLGRRPARRRRALRRRGRGRARAGRRRASSPTRSTTCSSPAGRPRDADEWIDLMRDDDTALLDEALAIWTRLGDEHGMGKALWGLGERYGYRGDFVQAEATRRGRSRSSSGSATRSGSAGRGSRARSGACWRATSGRRPRPRADAARVLGRPRRVRRRARAAGLSTTLLLEHRDVDGYEIGRRRERADRRDGPAPRDPLAGGRASRSWTRTPPNAEPARGPGAWKRDASPATRPSSGRSPLAEAIARADARGVVRGLLSGGRQAQCPPYLPLAATTCRARTPWSIRRLAVFGSKPLIRPGRCAGRLRPMAEAPAPQRTKTAIPRNPGRHDLGMQATLLFPDKDDRRPLLRAARLHGLPDVLLGARARRRSSAARRRARSPRRRCSG